jgi:hypothetical protein
MMKTHYTNETNKFQHIGGVTVPPGETREVDASALPNYQPEGAPPAPLQVDPIAELLKKKVADVAAALPELSQEDLGKVAALEQDGQNRKSLMEAIGAENLRRAGGGQ